MRDTAASRRSFVFLLMSMIQGILIVRPKTLSAAKQKGKDLVGRLERELLESSRPKRAMSISSGMMGDNTTLYREMGNKKIPVCSMNHTGSMIWELCDGTHSFKDICRFIVQSCQITEARAREDILAFMSGLNRAGAIRL